MRSGSSRRNGTMQPPRKAKSVSSGRNCRATWRRLSVSQRGIMEEELLQEIMRDFAVARAADPHGVDQSQSFVQCWQLFDRLRYRPEERFDGMSADLSFRPGPDRWEIRTLRERLGERGGRPSGRYAPGRLTQFSRKGVRDRKSTRLNSSHANISY